ncbi:Uncharacterised protein [Streptococcus pneumoniae]|nr:Uncharacterised protein [Streptococcus pneumoniae]CJI39502.1 Uncharacterised protein [Streptococcus pneumoniae]COK31667.1 Uncharacterised protein [Streptococcus pneumoniae]COL50700.1 Uncharacterised protein [Streptococcus pneumoniae]
MSRFFVWNRRYSKMKQEQDKSIRTVKSISNNVLEVDVYYSSFKLLCFEQPKVSFLVCSLIFIVYLNTKTP